MGKLALQHHLSSVKKMCPYAIFIKMVIVDQQHDQQHHQEDIKTMRPKLLHKKILITYTWMTWSASMMQRQRLTPSSKCRL
jgi:hypothetical protein